MPQYTGRPLYLRIADDLRRQILDGYLSPGDQLPSIADLVADYQTSTTTVRQAVGILRSEGHVLGQQGRGTYVRRARQRNVRVADHLYSERPAGSPIASAIAAFGGAARWEHRSNLGPAPAAVASRLAILQGDPIMTTDYRFFADDEPIMISTSYESLALTEGTPIKYPEGGKVVGVVARFDSIGMPASHVVEQVTARVPRPYEDEALRIPVGIPVMSIERTYFSGPTILETADIVVAGDNYSLRYVVPIGRSDITGK